MRHRALRFAVFAWVIFWFVGFAPAHQRGMIALDDSADGPAGPCCGSVCDPADRGGDSGAPPTDPPASDCAVCHLVAKLDVPQPFDFSLAPLAPAIEGCAACEGSLASHAAEAFYLGRAPPLG